MRRFITIFALVGSSFNGWTQTQKPPEKTWAFEEVKAEFQKRDYSFVTQGTGFDRFPTVPGPLFFDAAPDRVLARWLRGLNVGYSIRGSNILLWRTDTAGKGRKRISIYTDVHGIVLTADNQPLEGATVNVAGSAETVYTNEKGEFRLPVESFSTHVIVTHIGYQPGTVQLSNRDENSPIKLDSAATGLDKIVVQAYGNTTQRLSTGNITDVSGSQLEHIASGQVLNAMEARIPGLVISLYNGVAGSAPLVLLGGRHSVQQSNQPLYVLDGVPLATDGFLNPPGTGSAQGTGGANILNFISPDDIESVTVLKDAAATSIYGSRASNGVILIMLKKGKVKTYRPLHVSANLNYGVESAVHLSPLLSTTQFLQLRKEAVANDRLPVNAATVPEAYPIDGWDTSRQSNFQRLTTGAKTYIWRAGLQASGGSSTTYYFLSGQLHREATVFPGSTDDQRRSFYAHLHSQSADSRWQFDFSGLYSWEGNHLPIADFTASQILAPNAPAFTNAVGQLQWGTPPLSFVNIPALANNDYLGKVYTIFGQLRVHYQLTPQISFEEHVGYNGVLTDEQTELRLSGQDPSNNTGGQLTTIHNQYTHAMTETIARWKGKLGFGRLEGLLECLIGVDYQARETNYSSLLTGGYPNDQSLGLQVGATQYSVQTNNIPYHYGALFGRANYNMADRYILDASWRRDGSSRLGSQDPAGDFGAVGAGWIFSREAFIKNNGLISFGKLRFSFGTTGNEPVADDPSSQLYTQTASARGYRGQQGTVPASLANAQLRWERNYRGDIGIDLGFFRDRLLFAGVYSRSWTANQLVTVPVAPTAGLSEVLANQQGIDVVNRAFEFQLKLNRFPLGKLYLSAHLMLTLPRNQLLRWPGLAQSIYATSFVEGKSLSVSRSYHWTGVDPKTGLYTFQTANASGEPGVADEVPNAGLDPKYYAGWDQTLQIGNWSLEFLLDYRHQEGLNPLVVLARQNAPGMQGILQLSNGPVQWLDHWRNPGDIAHQQKPTAGYDPEAYARLQDLLVSDAWSIDASYLRLRMATLGYSLPARIVKKWRWQYCRFYINAENLLTLTHFPVTDPETQDPRVLPPMRIVAGGVQVSF